MSRSQITTAASVTIASQEFVVHSDQQHWKLNTAAVQQHRWFAC
jgi:hypothetical protein